MAKKRNSGRDYPLAPTNEVAARDKTSVSKPDHKGTKLYPNPEYIYKDREFSKKDSADYREGYGYGIKEVTNNPSRKNRISNSGPYKEGKDWIGLNNRFNEGFSEGKDKVLQAKKKK